MPTTGTLSRPAARPGLVLGIILAVQLMVVLDATIVNIALPDIARELKFSPTSLSWVITAYTLTFGGFLLLGARAGDLLGRKRVFMAGIGVFTVASLLGGLAPSGGVLLAARSLQGVGGALAAPSSLAFLMIMFPEGRERLRALGAPLPWERVSVLAPPVRALGYGESAAPAGAGDGAAPAAASVGSRERYALVVSRLAPEKGVDVAIDACRLAGIRLVVAGDGPEREALAARARTGKAGAAVSFAGHVDDGELARLRAGAAIALVPSRSGETFGLAAAEAMAAGLPVVASRAGALAELVEDSALVAPGDAQALARAIGRLAGDADAGARAHERVRAICAPERVAGALARIYDGSA